MTNSLHDTTKILQPGDVQPVRTSKGWEFFGHNPNPHKKHKPFGTLTAGVFEKVSPPLMRPEPSFTLSRAELKALVSLEAVMIQISDRSDIYTISLAEFMRLAIPYDNLFCGRQWRVPVIYFERHSTAAEEIVIKPLKRPSWTNLDLFSR